MLTVINAKLRRVWDRLVEPIGRGVGRSRVHPDAITLMGVILQGSVAWLIVDGRLLIAGLVSIAAGLADALDGAVAKAQNRAGPWGAFLDSTTDRLTDALYLLPIAWLYGVAPDTPAREDHVVAVLALTALVASFLVSYAKARAESLGFDCSVGLAERAERLIVIIAALLLDLVEVGMWILVLATVFTFLQRMWHVRAQASGSTVA